MWIGVYGEIGFSKGMVLMGRLKISILRVMIIGCLLFKLRLVRVCCLVGIICCIIKLIKVG